ncbi:cyclin-D3-1-like isoform X2 [Andrographis paniculata]|uniref:cyclin-D3-1-like isoform X2 n=1 Tax=Andrographis paniculata TaxID=175694 RepID=UPI0021E976F0|nr:cyclin-D3-1-like isoform X2 [Andrographis paniculata]
MPMSSRQQSSNLFFLDALYCQEQHWNNVIELESRPIEEEDDDDAQFEPGPNPNSLLGIFGGNSRFNDDEELKFLLNKEVENGFRGGFEWNPGLIEARVEAVEGIIRVVGHYCFSALTAILAIDYFDRFLQSCFRPQFEKPWMPQLAAVACLSLAAKVEETQVPLLLDLQVEETQYVFDSRTIQRMELLILSTLKWRMNPVTPLSFLECIVRGFDLESHFCGKFMRRSKSLLLSVISDCRLMRYSPSAMAAATMLYVISSLEPSIGVESQDKLAAILGTNKCRRKWRSA